MLPLLWQPQQASYLSFVLITVKHLNHQKTNVTDFFIIIIIYSGMTRRSNFPFQSVSETPFFCLYCKKRTKRKQQQKGKHTLITANKYEQEKK